MTTRRTVYPLLLLLLTCSSRAQVRFSEVFADSALRVDLHLVGNAQEEVITLDQLYLEGLWPENPEHAIEPFENGRYRVDLYDVASNRLIYSRGFDCMFGEYVTTTPARNGINRAFQRSLRVPCPRRAALLVIQKRDRNNIPHPVYTVTIDPASPDIRRESMRTSDGIHTIAKKGDPRQCLDVVFLAEGYAANEGKKFVADAERFTGYLLATEPYKAHAARINVTAIHRPSPESGTDEPREGRFRNTLFNASFNAFGLDRYLLTEENRLVRDVAGQVSYDAIVILVNSKRYGGGGIYNDYCITTVDHAASKKVFVHEFAHSFAGLADEYYAAEVAYNEFYPKGVEPLEPNITAALDPTRIKWADLLSPGIAIPTEYGKDSIEVLQEENRRLSEGMKKGSLGDKALTDSSAKERIAANNSQIERIRASFASLKEKVGVFEGAGYASKGLYRSMIECLMISSPRDEFCVVCRRGTERMLRFYIVP